MEVLITAVSTLGFPAAMAVVLMWFINKRISFEDNLYDDLKDVIKTNTEVIAEMKETLIGLREDVDDIQDKLK